MEKKLLTLQLKNRLTKQAIRRGVTIFCRNKILTKDEVIDLSTKWTEKELNLFRKMLKQGGRFSIQGVKFSITVPEQIYNNKGEVEGVIHENEEEQYS
jgi:hypothetical protein